MANAMNAVATAECEVSRIQRETRLESERSSEQRSREARARERDAVDVAERRCEESMARSECVVRGLQRELDRQEGLKAELTSRLTNAEKDLDAARGEVEACLGKGGGEQGSMKQMIRERRQRQLIEKALQEAQEATATAEEGLQAAMDQLDRIQEPLPPTPKPVCFNVGTNPEPFFEESIKHSRELQIALQSAEASLRKEAQRRLEAEKEADRVARDAQHELERVRDRLRIEADVRVETATGEAHRRAKDLEAKLDAELMRGLTRHREPDPDPRLAMTPQAMLQEAGAGKKKDESAILKLLRTENEALKVELATQAGTSGQEERNASLQKELDQLKQDRASRRASRRGKKAPELSFDEENRSVPLEAAPSPPKSPLSPKAHNMVRSPVGLGLKALAPREPTLAGGVPGPALTSSGAGARY